jgi:hypothetical protein
MNHREQYLNTIPIPPRILERICELLRSTESHAQTLQTIKQDIISVINDIYITNHEEPHELPYPPLTRLPTSHRNSRRPVFFHVVVITSHVGESSTTADDQYIVTKQPRNPEGCRCLLENGQYVVISPDHTVAWRLDSFHEEGGAYIVYQGIDTISGETCDIWVDRKWSSVIEFFN